MKNLKKLFAGCIAVLMTLSFAGCGGSNDSTKDSESSKQKDKIEVATTKDIADVPEGAEKELLFMGVSDLNPVGSNEKSVGLNLFEDKGGSIKYARVTAKNKFTKLGAAVTSGKEIPDIFKYEWLAFPCQVVQGFYQPIDDVVDFTSPMWVDVASTADQYSLDGKHYVAPISYNPSSMLFYDKKNIVDNGFEDPVSLYDEGEWTVQAMEDLMSEWCAGASGDQTRYGINGYFALQIVQQTGQTMVTSDDNITFKNNMDNPQIAEAEERLSSWKKNGYVEPSWYGSAAEAFKANCLFYGMGEWAATGTSGPASGEEWGVVPFPSDPKYTGEKPITTADMTAYMWVKGSEKKDAVKTFYECYRVAETDPTYVQNTKDKWLTDNKNWTEDDYDIIRSVADPNENLMIFDPAYGVSSLMGDDFGGFMSGVNLTGWLYNGCTKPDEQGVEYTWTQLKEKYSTTVDGELKTINQQVQKFLKK